MLVTVLPLRTRLKIEAGLAAVAVLLVWAAHSHYVLASVERIAAGAQDAALGPDWGRVRSARLTAASVPGLEAELTAARKAGVRPIIGGHARSGATEFHLPGQCPSPTDTPGVATAPGSSPGPSPLFVTGEASVLVGVKADGTATGTWRLWATLTQGDASERRELDNVVGSVDFDPSLAKLIRQSMTAAPPPAWEVRVGVGLPGPTARAGVTYAIWRHVGVWGDVSVPVGSGGAASAGAGVAVRF